MYNLCFGMDKCCHATRFLIFNFLKYVPYSGTMGLTFLHYGFPLGFFNENECCIFWII